MSKRAGTVRSALLGLLLALLGFSYSVATTTQPASHGGAASRAIGTIPLRFANPFFVGSTDRDLGDIVVASNFARFVRAIGGVPAYKFVSSSQTNHILFSEEFDKPVWDKNGGTSTVIPNSTVAPDGTFTAERIFKGTAGSPHLIQYFDNPLFAGKTVTFSVFVKVIQADKLQLALFDNVSGFRMSNITPDVSSTQFTRLAITGVLHADATRFGVGFGTASSDDRDFFAWGAQLELGSAASDYQTTTSAPATASPLGILVSVNDVLPAVQATDQKNQEATLGLNGVLTGLASNLFKVTPIRFQIAVVDSAATPTSGTNGIGNFKTEYFRLTLVSTKEFRFAVDALPDGLQLRQYFTRMEVLNEFAFPLTFSISDVRLDGVPQTQLEDLGLSLNAADGAIFGKPLQPGLITFRGECVNASSIKAKARGGSGDSQIFSIRVEPNSVVSSDLFTTGVQIKVDKIKKRGTVKFTGYPHLNSSNFALLVGSTLQLRLGRYVTPNPNVPGPVLIGLGTSIKTTSPPVAIQRGESELFDGKVSSRGLVTISVRNANFQQSFDTITGSTARLPVFLRIGGEIQGSEALEFRVKQTPKTLTLTYSNRDNQSLSGAMLLTSVKGKDSSTTDATAYLIHFLALPRSNKPISGASNADISIGLNFVDKVAVTERSGKVSNSGGGSAAPDKIAKFSLTSKGGSGKIQTGFLTSSKTGVPRAGPLGDGKTATGVPPGTRANFPVNITLTNGATELFNGENGIQIFSRKNTWGENPIR